LRVAYASTPKTRYAINAIAKRLITSDPANKTWCTGKDSNLRTSLGGTDLQSVGFNHSPTCAETAGRCSRCPSSSSSRPSCESAVPAAYFCFRSLNQPSQTRHSQNRETKNRAYEFRAKITASRIRSE